MKRAAAVFSLFLLTAALTINALWAQSPQEDVFRYPLGPQTMDAFRTACSRLAEHPFVQGNFEQEKTLSRLDRSLKSSGFFLIAADMGMVWDTVRPFPSTLTLGKDYLIQTRPSGQKTVISAQGNETFVRMADVIGAVFSGNSQGLLENFDVYYNGAGAAWELGLSPRDGAIGSFMERIIMKGDTAIRSIRIYEQGGDTITYIFSNHSYPAELSAHEKNLFSLP
ncbi:MAG: outer membrane lipoprotein carrier protein LolA [Treponema sp.]|nr:outer membrane lipoprotein carrier protein LolA [Treponema sp.]